MCSQCTHVRMVLDGWDAEMVCWRETVSLDFDFRGKQLNSEGRDFWSGSGQSSAVGSCSGLPGDGWYFARVCEADQRQN